MTINYQEEIKFISNKIRELRKEKQMTVQELAYRCDMERSNMSRIESGRTNLTVNTYIILNPIRPADRQRTALFLKIFHQIPYLS